jgi:hypothetical protein
MTRSLNRRQQPPTTLPCTTRHHRLLATSGARIAGAVGTLLFLWAVAHGSIVIAVTSGFGAVDFPEKETSVERVSTFAWT